MVLTKTNMQEAEFVFSLFFLLFAFGIIYPPQEFESLGWTLNNIFSTFLGCSDIEFVQYHLRRTCLTLFIHTILPMLYVVFYYLKFGDLIEIDVQVLPKFVFWNSFVICAFVMPIISAIIIYYWTRDDYTKHPLAQNLQKYSRGGWRQAAVDINAEYRRYICSYFIDDKIHMKTSAVHSVVATTNWIMKVSHYALQVAHQSDTALIAIQSDSHDLNEVSTESVQFVNIKVKPTRAGVSEFIIRINALDFKTLQDRIMRPITILDGVTFNKTVIDRFIEVFKQQVRLNPTYIIDEVSTDVCFACMIDIPNVKLQKRCTDDGPEQCNNCYCRVMWCCDCLAKWFASRQNQHEKEVWLQQKCSCPMCRATFCILDISYVELRE